MTGDGSDGKMPDAMPQASRESTGFLEVLGGVATVCLLPHLALASKLVEKKILNEEDIDSIYRDLLHGIQGDGIISEIVTPIWDNLRAVGARGERK